MSEFNWQFTYNSFEVATRNSAKKMNTFAPDHLSKLEAESDDPDIAAIAADTSPAVLNFVQKYNQKIVANGLYRGETKRFTNFLIELRTLKIKQWDAQIQVVFLEGTSDYEAILPNGRSPFQVGSYESRLAEVAGLAGRLLPYPALAALQVSVQAYYETLVSARDVQQQKEGLVNQASDWLNQARISLSQQLYKNLGLLMAKYYLSPNEIERFYDLELIRNQQSSNDDEIETITETVAAGAFKNVISQVFSPETIITINNTGTVPLLFYLGNTSTADIVPPSLGILVEPGITVSHPILEFGAMLTEFLNVKNNHAALMGSFEISVE